MLKIIRIPCRILVLVLALATFFAAIVCAGEKVPVKDFDFAKTKTFMREMDSRPDFPVSLVLANDYAHSLPALGDTIDPVKKSAIIAYIKTVQLDNGGFVADKASKNASLLYTDLALETLASINATGSIDAGKVKSFATSLKNPDGGFGFSKEAKESSLATTFYAVRVLKALGGLDLLDKAKTAEYLKGFEKKAGGFGFVKGPGVANAKSTYMAAFVLNTIGSLDDVTRNNAVKFLATTPYLDKQSKEQPELNEQYYAIKALQELNAADKVDSKLAMAFLKKIYISVNGGFGPLEGYGSTPDSTTTALRILVEIGKLKAPTK